MLQWPTLWSLTCIVGINPASRFKQVDGQTTELKAHGTVLSKCFGCLLKNIKVSHKGNNAQKIQQSQAHPVRKSRRKATQVLKQRCQKSKFQKVQHAFGSFVLSQYIDAQLSACSKKRRFLVGMHEKFGFVGMTCFFWTHQVPSMF